MKDLEIWKIVELPFDSSGILISSHGSVKKCDFEDKAIGDNGAGYKNFGVYVKNYEDFGRKSVRYYVHRVVAEKFVGKPLKSGMQVNHIDGDKSNNHCSNLEWVNPKENVKHMHENNLNINRRNLKNTVKLPDEVVLNAYLEVKIGMRGVAKSAEKYGMPRTTLSSIMNKRSRRDVTDLVDSYFML